MPADSGTAPATRAHGRQRHRGMDGPARLPRRRFAAPGGLEGLCARRAAAGEGIQRRRLRPAPVRFRGARASLDLEAAPRAARALGRGRGGRGERYGLTIAGASHRSGSRPRASASLPQRARAVRHRTARDETASEREQSQPLRMGGRGACRQARCCTSISVPLWATATAALCVAWRIARCDAASCACRRADRASC